MANRRSDEELVKRVTRRQPLQEAVVARNKEYEKQVGEYLRGVAGCRRG
jgi:hypothetical protein